MRRSRMFSRYSIALMPYCRMNGSLGGDVLRFLTANDYFLRHMETPQLCLPRSKRATFRAAPKTPPLARRANALLGREIECVSNDSFSKKAPPFVGLGTFKNGSGHLFSARLLTKEEEQSLFSRMNFLKYRARILLQQLDAHNPSEQRMDEIENLLDEAVQIQNVIIEANMRLVLSFAKKYVDGETSLDDLVSAGVEPLIRAIEKFDYSRGNRFSSYASRAIIRTYNAMYGKRQKDHERFETGTDDKGHDLIEMVAQKEDRISEADHASLTQFFTEEMLRVIDERELRIVSMRFGLGDDMEPKTLKEVGEALGISKGWVRQLEQRALAKLRLAAERNGYSL